MYTKQLTSCLKQGLGEREIITNEFKVSFRDNENVLKLDGGGDCTTLYHNH